MFLLTDKLSATANKSVERPILGAHATADNTGLIGIDWPSAELEAAARQATFCEHAFNVRMHMM
jgi:hypothetical protein